MQSRSHPIGHLILALAVAASLSSTRPAQELASLDLTKIEARVDLRRPKATSPAKGGYSGNDETVRCFDFQAKRSSSHTSSSPSTARTMRSRINPR